METEKREYIVWIDPTLKIAAFHEESGYERKLFTQYQKFMDYLQELSFKHFRFI